MTCLADSPEQLVIAFEARPILGRLLTRFEQCFKVVQHQEARPIPQDLQEHGQLGRFGIRRCLLLTDRKRIAPLSQSTSSGAFRRPRQ